MRHLLITAITTIIVQIRVIATRARSALIIVVVHATHPSISPSFTTNHRHHAAAAIATRTTDAAVVGESELNIYLKNIFKINFKAETETEAAIMTIEAAQDVTTTAAVIDTTVAIVDVISLLTLVNYKLIINTVLPILSKHLKYHPLTQCVIIKREL